MISDLIRLMTDSSLVFFARFLDPIHVRELDEDLDQFARRLRIKEYFHSKKETSEDLSTDESDIKEVTDIPRFVKT